MNLVQVLATAPMVATAPAALGGGHWWDPVNPFGYLSTAAAKVSADVWTTTMLAIWKAGLLLFRFVLNLVDAYTTPDLSESGPAREVYATTFWIAGSMILVLGMVQLGLAAVRRDGKSLATLALGVAKFMIVCGGWVSYGTALVAACGGLTKALMTSMLGVDSFAKWDPWQPVSNSGVTDAGIATLLGFLGVLLVFAAITHLLVMLARAGTLIVLAAVIPISAAGQAADIGQSWLWKSLRWFHAAAFTPVLMILVAGIGVQISTASVTSAAASAAGIPTQLASAVPTIFLILISCVAPLALFKLLAFVDPSTASGSAMRAGLAAQGGLSGMLSGSGASSGSGAAASADDAGRSTGEDGASDITSQRFTSSAASGSGGGSALGSLAGQMGGALGKGLGTMASLGASATAIGSDATNQMGAGHHSFHPDFTGAGTSDSSSGQGDPSGASADDAREPEDDAGGGMDPGQGLTPPLPTGGIPDPPSSPAGPPGAAGGSGGGAAAGGGSEAAAAAVVV